MRRLALICAQNFFRGTGWISDVPKASDNLLVTEGAAQRLTDTVVEWVTL